MSARLRVALAGAGMVAGHHLTAWRARGDADLVGICDPDRARAEARAREFGVAATFDSVEDMLEACGADVLDVVSPPWTHAAAVLAAAARGIAVQCQKPLAPSAEQARALAEAVAGRVPVMVHENWRFRAPYRRLKALIEAGTFGRIDTIALSVLSSGLIARGDGPPPALARQPFFADLDRFLVVEVLIHHLDTLGFLFGGIEVTAARLARRSGLVRAEDTAAILFQTRDGALGTLEASFAAAGAPPLPKDRLAVRGARASALADGWSLALDAGREAETWDEQKAYQASYDAAIDHFAACLRSGAPFETPMARAIETLDLVERVYALAGSVPAMPKPSR